MNINVMTDDSREQLLENAVERCELNEHIIKTLKYIYDKDFSH